LRAEGKRVLLGAGDTFRAAAIEQIAVTSEAFTKQANGATPKKVVVVPGRLVNLVV
ncbi:MAG: hypothetical protein ACO248_01195, partial [Burkholderiaceae bacterium]